jgi:eukaryotic-like serine/threonine-protein kinase
MNEDKGTGSTPPEEEPRTVVTPGLDASEADHGSTPEEERTVIAPAAAPEDERTVVAPAAPAPEAAMAAGATSMPTFSNFAPRTDGQGIQIGDVLNHIFEVKRFIARGGMGEVFEGINVNSDERVAIKVMLPALAADANVIALFRKEAKTLTKFSHDALVKYRTLAQEPQLGVLYIVTEYIDGTNLSDVLGTVKPDTEELAGLLRRLASGLAVAHSFGAIHRDISPDNVLLEEGKLSKAKVIDFGIAKDLDPSSKTIVGEGFAGKLNYVAPEQLGDFGREIGPWTDVYSLALVILAVIKGKNVQMGGSLVDAVDKRRAGPDLSEVPEKLKPILEAMLKADPKDRLRSMDDVLAMLDGAGMGGRTMLGDGTLFAPGEARGVSKPALFGAIAAGVAILGAGAFFATRSSGPSPEEEVQLARVAINQAMPSIECSWLDIAGIQAGEPLAIRMTGVAGNPVAARTRVSQAVTTAGVTNPAVNVDEVAIIRPQGCSALQAFGKIRATGDKHMSVPQREFEMTAQPAGSQYPVASQAQVTLRPPDGKDLSLLGIEPNGTLSELLPSRQALEQAVADGVIEQIGPGEYRVDIDMNHTGWSGLVLLVGDGPFDKAVTQPPIDARGEEWQSNFVATASERDWKSEMIWFKSVDKQPN